ncbi:MULTISPECIES: hypothetical protein [Micrococcaceae]|uniref:hypothetical protein n=1 Tax=Micrococcaceae TaxID=1268 RepID=UPI0012E377F0|nr:hypothetical protein [Arthrobacter sp. Soil761]
MEIEAGASVRVTVAASDGRGYAYALTEVAERIKFGGADALSNQVHYERAAAPVRGIQRSFSSAQEDLPWFHDRSFWSEYLDHLAKQRFNRFQLALGMQYNYGAGMESRTASDNYLCFAYPFLLAVPGFEVRAQGVSSGERDRNLETLAFIAKETRRRGMSFNLGLWNHAYDFGHDSMHWYPILGISRDTHARYSAAALARLLELIPEIDGLTFRVHHEGGIHEEGHELFWDQVFDAVSKAGRPMEVDMHAKGVDEALMTAVDKPNIRATISAKYWAEHMGLPYHQASIREMELKQFNWPGKDKSVTGVTDGERRFTRYGYADFLSEDRSIDVIFRMWPGTQKLLLWGDPSMAAGFGRYATLGGSRGLEICEPLYFKGRKGTGQAGTRDPYIRPDLQLGINDWRKYRYTYLLWGRLLYNPDTSPEVWQRFLQAEYGPAAKGIETALASLSKVLPLVTVAHGVSGANNFYWPEMYVDLAISYWKQSLHYAFDTPEPRTWEGVSPFDPTLFYGVGEYADDLIAGQVQGKYTPLEVASWIESALAAGELGISEATPLCDEGDPQTQRTLIDLKILAELGRFFAGKFRGAVEYAVYRRTDDKSALERAIGLVTEAHAAYARIPSIVNGVYRSDLPFGTGPSERGHWSDRIMAMREDLYLLKLELDQAREPNAGKIPAVIHRSTRRSSPASLEHDHRFERARPFAVYLRNAEPGITGATLHYRHLHQGKRFQSLEMKKDDGGFVASIPADYTASTYPLMFFAEVRNDAEGPLMIPGLAPDLSNQPYVVVHSVAWDMP